MGMEGALVPPKFSGMRRTRNLDVEQSGLACEDMARAAARQRRPAEALAYGLGGRVVARLSTAEQADNTAALVLIHS